MRQLSRQLFNKLKAVAAADVGELIFPDNCEGPDTGFDLFFVHGLRGSRTNTWSCDGVFWPHDFLKDDLENIRVITWGYDANIANPSGPASAESLYGHASTLLGDLARIRRNINRPIIFICHSLGGLVVKQALITASSYQAYGGHPSLGKIYNDTSGVIFMGTPHRGSATVAYGEVLVKIAKLTSRQPNEQLLRTLRIDSHILEQQRDGFIIISQKMDIVCINEELPMKIGLVVPKSSASFDGVNVVRASIPANHSNMVKFATKDAVGYRITLEHIRNLMSKQQPGNDTVEARNNEILDALSFRTIHEREHTLDEAYNNTCAWVWSHENLLLDEKRAKPYDFTSWLQSFEPILWISGKAGCGKSTLMKYIHHDPRTKALSEASPWANGKDLIILRYFFYELGSDLQKSREGMLRTMLIQVLNERRHLIPMVFPRLFGDANKSSLHQFPPDTLMNSFGWTNLRAAFISVLEHLKDSRLLIFLDGLDEYRMAGRDNQYTEEELDLIYDGNNEDDAWGRSTWITDGHREIAQFIHSLTTGGNAKVCISSRELNLFEHTFRHSLRIRVHDHTSESIKQYCENRLTQEAPELTGLPEFISDISGQSCGVFLWVRLIVDMLVEEHVNGGHTNELQEIVNKLPSRLGGKNGLYMHMMRNIERRYLPESRRLFQLAARCHDFNIHDLDIIALFLAEEGYLLEENSEVMRASNDKFEPKTWSEWETRMKNLSKRLKGRCGLLLEGTDKVRFMHQTVQQFITRKYLWAEIFGNATGFRSEIDVDLALLSGLIRRLKCCAEAVVCSGEDMENTRFQQASDAADADPYFEVKNSSRTVELFNCIVAAGRFCHKPGLDQSVNHERHFMKLLDELDVIGRHHTEKFRAPRNIPDTSWPGAYIVLEAYDTRLGFAMNNSLDFTIITGIYPLVGNPIEGHNYSKDELSLILLKCARYWDWSFRQDPVCYSWAVSTPLWFIESVLHEGADPNLRTGVPCSDTSAKASLTPWTCLLDQFFTREKYTHWLIDPFIETAKVFLEHGADPTVQWHRTDGRGVDTVGSALEGCIERLKAEACIDEFSINHLEELSEILRQTEEKRTRQLADSGTEMDSDLSTGN